MRSSAAAFVLVLGVAASAGAQTRTPWGDPDIQGVWSNQNPVPFERPAAQAKAAFEPDEAAEFEKTSLPRLLKNLGDEVSISGELNDIWLETAKGRLSPSRATSLVVNPPDGRVPYTPEGKKRWDATPKLQSAVLLANKPEDRAPSERCITTDGLMAPNPFYNNLHQIVQAPGYVVILTEMMHEARIIPLDRRTRLGDGVRMYLGDSRGRWEGDTLVVETVNYNDQKLFHGATRGVQMVERFRRLDADTIEYRLTVTDPATFTRPWTIENGLRRADGDLYEVACHEGNYGMRGILSAARAEESQGR